MEQFNAITDKSQRGAQDSGSYFRYMAEFVGFDKNQADAVYESRFIIEKYIPEIVGQFYIHLLRYPPTRRFFLNKDGSINHEYVQMRMQHLSHFWRRTAYGPYDDEYARYIDYVGRAHTRRGADPNIDIAERYVIGQVGFVQHAISEALSKEIHAIDPEWEMRALRGWNLLMMVILEMLARVYHEHDEDPSDIPEMTTSLDINKIENLAVSAYERSVELHRLQEIRQTFYVCMANEIPVGERKIATLVGHTIGVFHLPSGWYAIKNRCLHAGGPVAEGRLRDDVITCPWHGYQYDLPSGTLLSDPTAKLEMYPLEILDGQVFVKLPVLPSEAGAISTLQPETVVPETRIVEERALAKNDFLLEDLKPGEMISLEVNGESVVAFNVEGEYFALENYCPHAGGPLSEGTLEDHVVVCPWHGSCFDIKTGAVKCGPAKQDVRTFQVVRDGATGRVE
jgi:nitrite reductase/ring-hydroxylating ferredoxin subunit